MLNELAFSNQCNLYIQGRSWTRKNIDARGKKQEGKKSFFFDSRGKCSRRRETQKIQIPFSDLNRILFPKNTLAFICNNNKKKYFFLSHPLLSFIPTSCHPSWDASIIHVAREKVDGPSGSSKLSKPVESEVFVVCVIMISSCRAA